MNDAEDVMGYPDDLKLRSSMTLFSQAVPSVKIFQQVLDKYFDGKMDQKTLEILESMHDHTANRYLHSQDKALWRISEQTAPNDSEGTDYRSSYSGHEKAGKAADEGGAGGGAGISGRASPYILMMKIFYMRF